MKKAVFLLCATMLSMATLAQQSTPLQKVSGGSFVPLYGVKGASVYIPAFLLDEHPVTNEQFAEFVKNNPEWQRGNVKQLFADDMYLRTWESSTNPGPKVPADAPVTNVSWYAAKEYCKCQGKRLPTMNEWEYAAMASETKANAQKDSLFNQKIIRSYENPKTYNQPVKSTYRNYYGIWDMHGLVWEWTSDFNSVLISGESRKDGDTDRQLFCASGSVNATDLMNYAAFMRYAFRGSVKANYAIINLGFRCAQDAP